MQTEDSFVKMIIEYVEEQLTFGKPRESIYRELKLSGFDEESICMVTEMAASNCQTRYSNKRNKDMGQGIAFVLAGLFMVLLYVSGILGATSALFPGLLIVSGAMLIIKHIPSVAHIRPAMAGVKR
jgi:hypothetical protein